MGVLKSRLQAAITAEKSKSKVSVGDKNLVPPYPLVGATKHGDEINLFLNKVKNEAPKTKLRKVLQTRSDTSSAGSLDANDGEPSASELFRIYNQQKKSVKSSKGSTKDGTTIKNEASYYKYEPKKSQNLLNADPSKDSLKPSRNVDAEQRSN